MKIEAHSAHRTTLAVWRGASDILQITIRICHKLWFTMHCHNVTMPFIRAPSKRGRYWEIHPRCPRDFPRDISMVEGNLEGRGGGFPNTSLVWMVHGYNPRPRDNKISYQTNPSHLMLRECPHTAFRMVVWP